MASGNRNTLSLFTKLSSSFALTALIANSPAALAQGVWQAAVAVKRRRDLSQLADRDDHLLADVGLTRDDLRAAASAPFWSDPTDILERRVNRRRALSGFSVPPRFSQDASSKRCSSLQGAEVGYD